MPVPLACETIERASGSVSESCPSGCVLELLVRSRRMRASARAACSILSCSRSVLASNSAGLGAVGGVERVEVALDALFDLLLALVDLAGREVAVAAVDRLELAAVDGDHAPGRTA